MDGLVGMDARSGRASIQWVDVSRMVRFCAHALAATQLSDLEQHPLERARHPRRNEQAACQTEHREHCTLANDQRNDLSGRRRAPVAAVDNEGLRSDATTFAAAAVVIVVATGTASFLPAWRAAGIDPAELVKAE
jgi:hypothetical protein